MLGQSPRTEPGSLSGVVLLLSEQTGSVRWVWCNSSVGGLSAEPWTALLSGASFWKFCGEKEQDSVKWRGTQESQDYLLLGWTSASRGEQKNLVAGERQAPFTGRLGKWANER